MIVEENPNTYWDSDRLVFKSGGEAGDMWQIAGARASDRWRGARRAHRPVRGHQGKQAVADSGTGTFTTPTLNWKVAVPVMA